MPTETSLTIVTATTGHEVLNYTITLSEGQQSVTMSFDDFNRKYYDSVKNKLSPILKTIISNLLRSRDFLGLQLNLEFGNITNEQYEQLELEFLSEPQEIDPIVLKSDIDILMNLSNRVFNAEEISTMFNCSVETAEKAIDQLLLEEVKK